jgi:hypothetical protein
MPSNKQQTIEEKIREILMPTCRRRALSDAHNLNDIQRIADEHASKLTKQISQLFEAEIKALEEELELAIAYQKELVRRSDENDARWKAECQKRVGLVSEAYDTMLDSMGLGGTNFKRSDWANVKALKKREGIK